MTNQTAQTAKKWIDEADAILVTASNGLAISEGLNLFSNDQKLKEVLGDLVDKYQLPNLLTAFGYHYPNQLDYWRAVSRTVEYYGNNYKTSDYMKQLKQIINGRPHFIWTSNTDHHFALSGFENLFEVEGNWFEAVCRNHPDQHGVYHIADQIHEFYQKDQAGTVTETDIPTCEECDSPLTLNLAGENFQINQTQVDKFHDFVQKYKDQRLVVLELGIGPRNQMIKAPSMQLVSAFSNIHYLTINKGEVFIPDEIADRSIGYSTSIENAFKEILTGKSYGSQTQGPTEKMREPELSPEQKDQQAKMMQRFYPNYMVNAGIRQGSIPMYLTIDQQHPSYLHAVQYGQSWMYSIGDAATVHCFTQDGQYYQVRLGLNKQRHEVHGFYADPGTFIAIETTGNSGVGFSQVSTEMPINGDGTILVPKKEKIMQLFPQHRELIEKFSID